MIIEFPIVECICNKMGLACFLSENQTTRCTEFPPLCYSYIFGPLTRTIFRHWQSFHIFVVRSSQNRKIEEQYYRQKSQSALRPNYVCANFSHPALNSIVFISHEMRTAALLAQTALPFNSTRMNFHYKLKSDKMETFYLVNMSVFVCECMPLHVLVCVCLCMFSLYKYQNN